MDENEFEGAGKYPMPVKDKPLKIDGTEIGSIILVPKGVDVAVPKVESQVSEAKDKDKDKTDQELESKKEELESKNSEIDELEKQLSEATAKLNDIRDAKRTDTISEIVDVKMSAGVITEDKKDEATKDMSKLTDEALEVMLSEAEVLADYVKKDKKVTGKPKSGSETTQVELSDVDQKKATLRAQLFPNSTLNEGE